MTCTQHTPVRETHGGSHYSAGDVWDDIETRVVCTTCGLVLCSENGDEPMPPLTDAEFEAMASAITGAMSWERMDSDPDKLVLYDGNELVRPMELVAP